LSLSGGNVVGGFASINQSDSVNLIGTFSDVNVGDTESLVVDWGDGLAPTTTTLTGSTGNFSINYIYSNVLTQPSIDSIKAYVVDNFTGRSPTLTLSGAVIVTDIAPTLSNISGSKINENDLARLNGTIVDIGGANEVFAVTVNWGDNGATNDVITGLGTSDASGSISSGLTTTSYSWTASTGGLSLSHRYLSPGTDTSSSTHDYTATVVVADKANATSSQSSATITVQNVAPALTNLNVTSTVNEGGLATYSGTIVDAGTLDVFTIKTNWGDGPSDTITGLGTATLSGTSGLTNYTWSGAGRLLTLTHQYINDGRVKKNLKQASLL
jgi:hypothetical protein